MRFFITAGPCAPRKHHMLPPERLLSEVLGPPCSRGKILIKWRETLLGFLVDRLCEPHIPSTGAPPCADPPGTLLRYTPAILTGAGRPVRFR